MHPKLFIFGAFMLLTYRSIEGQNVDGDGFSLETDQTGVTSNESSTETSINVNQSTEYQYIKNPDEDVSETFGRKPIKIINILKPDPLKPNPKPTLHPNLIPPHNPNARPSPNPNHHPSRTPPTPPSRTPPTPPTRPARKPATRPSLTPATRPSHTPPRPPPTPTRPDRTTPTITQKPTTPSLTPKPRTPESTTHSVSPQQESTTHGQTSPLTSESTPYSLYQTTPGYNAGIYTSTQHFTDKVNGWLNVASGASDQLNKEISKWRTLGTTPYNVGAADVTPETPSEGDVVDDSYGSDVTESSADSTLVDDWTPVLPDVTEPNSTDTPTNVDETSASTDTSEVDETSASTDTSKVDETTSDMDQTPGLV